MAVRTVRSISQRSPLVIFCACEEQPCMEQLPVQVRCGELGQSAVNLLQRRGASFVGLCSLLNERQKRTMV